MTAFIHVNTQDKHEQGKSNKCFNELVVSFLSFKRVIYHGAKIQNYLTRKNAIFAVGNVEMLRATSLHKPTEKYYEREI